MIHLLHFDQPSAGARSRCGQFSPTFLFPIDQFVCSDNADRCVKCQELLERDVRLMAQARASRLQ